jgi:hypothetical protein
MVLGELDMWISVVRGVSMLSYYLVAGLLYLSRQAWGGKKR